MFFRKKGLLNNPDASQYTIETLSKLVKDQQIIIHTLQKHVLLVETSLEDLKNFIESRIGDPTVHLKDKGSKQWKKI